MKPQPLIPIERIERIIINLRGYKVILDQDIAELYQIPVKILNQTVKRNSERFPLEFMFQLTQQEFTHLKSQFVTSSSGWGGRRKLPYAFTEYGVAMLSSVLHSERAVSVNIEIIRAFVRLRKMLIAHDELADKLKELEVKYDQQFHIVFDAIRKLMIPPEKEKRKIGFPGNE